MESRYTPTRFPHKQAALMHSLHAAISHAPVCTHENVSVVHLVAVVLFETFAALVEGPRKQPINLARLPDGPPFRHISLFEVRLVTEVEGAHNGWIQRRKVQTHDRPRVEPGDRGEHGRALVRSLRGRPFARVATLTMLGGRSIIFIIISSIPIITPVVEAVIIDINVVFTDTVRRLDRSLNGVLLRQCESVPPRIDAVLHVAHHHRERAVLLAGHELLLNVHELHGGHGHVVDHAHLELREVAHEHCVHQTVFENLQSALLRASSVREEIVRHVLLRPADGRAPPSG